MPKTHADDQLARELLTTASAFTSEVLSLAAGARVQRRLELAAHLEQLAAEVAGTVLDAVSAWPVAGMRVS